MNAGEILNLINKWHEVYEITDKRTKHSKEIKETIYKLSNLIGLI